MNRRRRAWLCLLTAALAGCGGAAASPASSPTPAAGELPEVTVEPVDAALVDEAAARPSVSPGPAAGDEQPLVQADNLAPLHAVRFPFADYLTAVHRALHPRYSAWLASNAAARGSSGAAVVLELGIEPTKGELARVLVVRPSGDAALDAAALDAARAAAPFGPAPEEIVSPGGLVWIHWRFASDAAEGCSPRDAAPFLLKRAP